eukprot:SAG11_NODE_590_length_8314_cov_44.934388_9_plen_282_part_01
MRRHNYRHRTIEMLPAYGAARKVALHARIRTAQYYSDGAPLPLPPRGRAALRGSDLGATGGQGGAGKEAAVTPPSSSALTAVQATAASAAELNRWLGIAQGLAKQWVERARSLSAHSASLALLFRQLVIRAGKVWPTEPNPSPSPCAAVPHMPAPQFHSVPSNEQAASNVDRATVAAAAAPPGHPACVRRRWQRTSSCTRSGSAILCRRLQRTNGPSFSRPRPSNDCNSAAVSRPPSQPPLLSLLFLLPLLPLLPRGGGGGGGVGFFSSRRRHTGSSNVTGV